MFVMSFANFKSRALSRDSLGERMMARAEVWKYYCYEPIEQHLNYTELLVVLPTVLQDTPGSMLHKIEVLSASHNVLPQLATRVVKRTRK